MQHDGFLKVLLVHPDPDRRRVYRGFLERAGLAVVEGTGGVKEMLKAAAHRPDAIVIGLSMPGLYGLEFARRLRAYPQTKEIPIISVVSESLLGYEELAVDAGVTEALSWPCEPAELLAAIREVT